MIDVLIKGAETNSAGERMSLKLEHLLNMDVPWETS